MFLPGFAEINQVDRDLKHKKANYEIYRVHSTLTTHKNNAELDKLLSPPAEGKRKIILSTIICESSITVPDIRYVIDSCMTKINKKDETLNLNQLSLAWASHENCKQRKGRAGRVADGKCFRSWLMPILPKSFFYQRSHVASTYTGFCQSTFTVMFCSSMFHPRSKIVNLKECYISLSGKFESLLFYSFIAFQ